MGNFSQLCGWYFQLTLVFEPTRHETNLPSATTVEFSSSGGQNLLPPEFRSTRRDSPISAIPTRKTFLLGLRSERTRRGFHSDHTELFLQLDSNDSNYYFVDTMTHEIVVAIIAVKLKDEFRMACKRETLLGPLLNLCWCRVLAVSEIHAPLFPEHFAFQGVALFLFEKGCVYISSSRQTHPPRWFLLWILACPVIKRILA